MKQRLQVILSILFLFTSTSLEAKKNNNENIPSPLREMRGVWVTTVANIDWPSRPDLSVEEQKKEMNIILDRIKDLNMNVVILQVRPQADAIYKSELEPWSYYLTGEQGKAPEPFYDPLELWIEESHARGLELHAWFNPYRANHSAMRGELSPLSIVKAKPNLVRKLGDVGYYWMDPAIQEVQDRSYAVVMDVVKRYDVDGVQFDDYFYPYTEYNDGNDFPDDESYKAYTDQGGKLSRGDWRRDAVNKFVERIYKGIKDEKPLVKFSISPFGVYRPGFPEGIAVGGFDQYETLYADAKLWLNKGWVDYYAPQLYWPISRMDLSYPLLLNWWVSENIESRNLWPGLFIRGEIEPAEMSLEIVNQIMVTRGMIPNGAGVILFSMKRLIPKDSLASKSLIEGPFASQSLVPAFPWLDNEAPGSPNINAEKKDGELKISWSAAAKEKPFLYVVYIKNNDRWEHQIFPGNEFEIFKKLEGTNITAAAISAVDLCGNESEKNIVVIE